jgi:hypothetical protein
VGSRRDRSRGSGSIASKTYTFDAKELTMSQQSHPLNPSPEAPAGTSRSDLLRTVLWAVLVVGAVGNMIASAAAASLLVHLALGAVSALALAGLVAQWTRTRA